MAGLWLEEFEVGRVFDHPLRRTVTETDNLLMSALTHNPAPLHLDAEYMKGTEYGRILVNSCFTLGLMVGISVNDTTQGTAEVLDVRESRSRPGQGIVTFAHRAYNQDDVLVAHCKRMSLQRRRPAANA
jgi:acyl dehydratase